MWWSFLFSVDTGGVESELESPMRCGGDSRDSGKFVSWNRILWHATFGHMPSRRSRVKRSNLYASRKMASRGRSSHLSPSVARNIRNCCKIPISLINPVTWVLTANAWYQHRLAAARNCPPSLRYSGRFQVAEKSRAIPPAPSPRRSCLAQRGGW